MAKGKRALSVQQVAALSANGTHWVADRLYLQIREHGTRSWTFRYVSNGKTRWHGLGSARDVSLREARETVEELRVAMRREGKDPVEERKALRADAAKARVGIPSFEWCAREYITAHEISWRNAKHREQWQRTLEMYANPVIGKLSVDKVTTEHVLRILKPIWVAKPETATRLRGRIEKVLGWATAKKYRSGDNPARWQGGDLSHLLPAISDVQKIEHHRAVPYAELPGLMAKLRAMETLGSKALRFTILTACRTSEILGMSWAEVDLETASLSIPPSRMKNGHQHIVPLSDEAIAILKSMPRTSALVFPGPKGKPLSNMTMIKCLRTLRDDEPTVHGFRSSFSVWAREQTDTPAEVIESALAHKQSDKVVAAYARTTYFDRRRALMADWARYCMGTKAD